MMFPYVIMVTDIVYNLFWDITCGFDQFYYYFTDCINVSMKIGCIQKMPLFKYLILPK